jgi:anion-transporting  ArsA/GET3 family ATPase
MAMERLYELATGEGYDSIVIDTPPTRSALSFLDAPRRMTDFLGGRVLRWLLWPYRRAGMAGLRGASLGARMLARTIGKVAGAEVLADTAEFLGAFEGMYDGFRRRAEAVTALLSEPRTVFVVVAAPEPESLGEAGGFVERLDRNGMHLAGVVVNRVRSAPPLPEGATSEALARLEQGDQTDRALAASLAVARRLDATERSQRAAVDRFRRSVPDAAVTLVPEQPSDVHDLAGLEGLRDALVG